MLARKRGLRPVRGKAGASRVTTSPQAPRVHRRHQFALVRYLQLVKPTIKIALDYSPDGPVNVVPNLAGVPKFGVPFEFQLTFCAIVYLFPSQAPALLAVA